MTSKLRPDAGAVLVVVLWVLVLLTVLAASFSATVRQKTLRSLHAKERLQGYLAARGAVVQMMADLPGAIMASMQAAADADAPKPCYGWGEPGPLCGLDTGPSYRLVLEDVTSGVNLNAEDDTLLDLLLQKVGVDPDRRAMIRDSIKDWRDKDDLRRLNGAEEEDYQALETPYHCKNGDFDSVDELLLVRGVTRELFYGGERDGETVPGIVSFLTVTDYRSGEEASKPLKSRVNVNTGPVEMLALFPGVSPEMIEELKTLRRDKGRLTSSDVAGVLGGDVYPTVAPYLSWGMPSVVRITALGYAGGELPAAAVQCVVRWDKTAGRVEVLEWVDAVDWHRYVQSEAERDQDA
jgi:general secretion pathway protein K